MSQLAAARPDRAAVVFVPSVGRHRTVTWREFDETAIRLAHLMQSRGVEQGDLVVVGLPNCPEHYFSCHAAWKLGATVLPISYRAPAAERDALLELANPVLVVSDWDDVAFPGLSSRDLAAIDPLPTTPLPDRVANPGRAMGSGGSTGRPKIIVNPGPWAWRPGDIAAELGAFGGLRPGQTQLVAGPLYHNSPFGWSNEGLFEDHTLVLFERFDAAAAVAAIERYRISFAFLAPTMMQRILQLPDIRSRDLSSLDAIFHTAAPCPEWVKRGWIELIGAEKVYEGFGSTEAVGVFTIRGDEWLEHPGSVGRPRSCELRLLDGEGHEVPPGEVGEIFTRPIGMTQPPYSYIGSPPARSTSDGFMSVGDLGWLDADGYLHPADRRVDLIISGGANIFPAEVEAALSSHAEVADVAVIGLPDEEWGKRVHAIIRPADATHPSDIMALDRYARERLTSFKVPKTYEFVDQFPRDASGKLRRTKLVADRSNQATGKEKE